MNLKSFPHYRPLVALAKCVVALAIALLISSRLASTAHAAGQITGRVTSTDGIPIANAIVRLYHMVENNGQSQWQCCIAETRTDPGGDYEFLDIPPGNYRLYVQATWLGYNNEYYLHAQTVEQAQDIQIALGKGANSIDVLLSERTEDVEQLLLPSAHK